MSDAAFTSQGALLLALNSIITRLHERCTAHSESAARHLQNGDERLAGAEGAVAYALAELAAALRQAAGDVASLQQRRQSLPAPRTQPPADAALPPPAGDAVRLPPELDAETRALVCRFAEALAQQMLWRQQLERRADAWRDAANAPTYLAQLSAARDSHPLEVAELAAYLWYHGVISLRD